MTAILVPFPPALDGPSQHPVEGLVKQIFSIAINYSNLLPMLDGIDFVTDFHVVGIVHDGFDHVL